MKNKMIISAALAAVMLAGSAMTSWADSGVVVAGQSSPVIGAGGAGAPSYSAGPGVTGPGGSSGGPGEQGGNAGGISEIPGRVDYFSASVQNPVVPVTDRYSYDRMVQDIQTLQSRYSGKMQTNVIGTSLDGRSIYEVILGNPNAEKHILIHAGIHAREYMTPLLVMKQLEYGLAFYESASYDGQPLSNILNHVAVHFVPMANPDGTSLSEFGISAIRSEELKREISQCYANDVEQGRTSMAFDRYLNYWKANARGVDLNQNFPADWEQVSSTPAPSYATYRGPSALSEPESQALANLANSRIWAATISYHSMGNVIYWDYAGNRVQQQSGELATIIAANTGCRPAGSSGHGGFKDWVQIKDNPIPSLTIEVGRVACPMPVSEFEDVWYRNKMVWALTAKYAMEH